MNASTSAGPPCSPITFESVADHYRKVHPTDPLVQTLDLASPRHQEPRGVNLQDKQINQLDAQLSALHFDDRHTKTLIQKCTLLFSMHQVVIQGTIPEDKALNSEIEHVQHDLIKKFKTLVKSSIGQGKPAAELGLRFIQDYNIQTEALRYEVALVVAETDGWACSEAIGQYRLNSSHFLFEVAKKAMVQNVWGTCNFIKNYCIPQFHYKLAKLAAKHDGLGISSHIKEFELELKQRFKVACRAIWQNAEAVARHFEDFEIDSHEMRYETARLMACVNGKAVSNCLSKFHLTDDEELYKIALAAFSNDPRGSVKCIAEYHIEEESRRFELLKIAVSSDSSKALQLLQEFQITSQDYLFEIAKIEASQDGWKLSGDIAKYKITDPQRRFELAKLSAIQNGAGAVKFLDRYDLARDKRLVVYQLAAQFHGPAAIGSIKQIDPSADELLQILKEALTNHPIDTLKMVSTFGIDSACVNMVTKQAILRSFILLLTGKSEQIKTALWRNQGMDFSPFGSYKETLDYLVSDDQMSKELSDSCFAVFKKQFYDISSEPNELLRQRLHQWLSTFACACFIAEVKTESIVANYQLVTELLLYKDPEMRGELGAYLLNVLTGDSRLKAQWDTIRAHCEPAELSTGLLLSSFNNSENILFKLRTTHLCKDATKRKNINRFIYLLANCNLFTNDQKVHVLEMLMNSPREHQLADFQIAEDLIVFGKGRELATSTSHQQMEALLEDVFRGLFYLKTTPDFAHKYDQTVARFRDKVALITYAARLQSLPENERELAKKLYSLYLDAVLCGKLPEVRYDLSESLHLRTVFKNRPQLFEEWKKGESLPATDLDKKAKPSLLVEDSDDACDLLLLGTELHKSCLKVNGEARLNKCLLAYLLDGKNRAIVVKDSGRIIGRCILRLLWDNTTKQPVLFQEKHYVNHDREDVNNLLEIMCQRRAKKLGLLLLTKNKDSAKSHTPYKNKVQSLSCRARFEYVDALEKHELTNGIFTLDNCWVK